LTSTARAEFKRLSPWLERHGLLTQIDIAPFVCLCQAIVDHRWAVATLEKEGMVSMTSKGTPTIHPAVRIQRSAADAILRFSNEFGLTPAARAGLDIVPVDDDDDDEAFFGQLARHHRKRALAQEKKR
jgi:P27 family predicted phage terminase small subunit